MLERPSIAADHPLRQLFKKALDYGFKLNPTENEEIAYYIEEQILCEFIHINNLYKINDAAGNPLDDTADMMAEGDVLLNARSFEQEFKVHKHIGDYTLFMLGMFPSSLDNKKGREFILGSIVVFLELSVNFEQYKSIMEFVRTYLESLHNDDNPYIQKVLGGRA
ncbi:MAG: hypothetical protein AMK70_08850 [Nitrospira bacterium SG8_35_1]|nr:MAG: hypothetical protein AMK70_08850 [Nitrospira bacterium SG8_35_1]